MNLKTGTRVYVGGHAQAYGRIVHGPATDPRCGPYWIVQFDCGAVIGVVESAMFDMTPILETPGAVLGPGGTA